MRAAMSSHLLRQVSSAHGQVLRFVEVCQGEKAFSDALLDVVEVAAAIHLKLRTRTPTFKRLDGGLGVGLNAIANPLSPYQR